MSDYDSQNHTEWEVSVHGLAGDWSIFRPKNAFRGQTVGRKHGPVPFPRRAAKIGTVPCKRLPPLNPFHGFGRHDRVRRSAATVSSRHRPSCGPILQNPLWAASRASPGPYWKILAVRPTPPDA